MTATLIPNADDLRIAEQLALAKNLREKGMAGTGGSGMAGNVYMVGNQWGNLAQSLGGAAMQYMGQRDRDALEASRNQQYEDYMRQMPSATEEQTYSPVENPGTGPLINGPVLKSARQQQQEMNKFALNAPDIPQFQALRQAGMAQALSAPEKQAAAEEAAVNRKAILEMTLADRAASREEKAEAEKKLEQLRQEGRRELRVLAASLRPPPAPHNAQTVVSDQGILERQPDGTWKPIMVGDKPAMRPPTAGGKGGQLPIQAQKLQSSLQNLESGLNAYEKLLKQYDPRSPDALTPEKRAALSTAFGDLRMQLKGAYELGAITGPDMQVLEGVLTDPTGILGMGKGALSGNKAFDAQISQARAALNRQKRNFEQQYNLTLPEPAGTATADMPGGIPKFDADKEARYQEWLKGQPK